MFEVYNKDRSKRFGFSGDPQPLGVGRLGAVDARKFALSGDLVCASPSCTTGLTFISPSQRSRAHWRHDSAQGESVCAISQGRASEGEWHLRVKNEFFGPYAKFEQAITTTRGDARLDVLVQNGDRKFAVEVQHSSIGHDVALERIRRHRSYGLKGTIWIVDGKTAGLHPDDLAWLSTATAKHPGKRGDLWGRRSQQSGVPGKPNPGGILVQNPSTSALLKICAEVTASGYPSVVLIAVEDSQGALVARRALEGHAVDERKESGFLVRAFSPHIVGANRFRNWAAGRISGDKLVVGPRESGEERDREIYIFDRDKIRIFLKSESGGYVARGGFLREPKGWLCPCSECCSRRKNGLNGIHTIGLVTSPNRVTLDYLRDHFDSPYGQRSVSRRIGRTAVRILDPRAWSDPALASGYGAWIEDLDETLKSIGWTADYLPHPTHSSTHLEAA